ncbi:MAG: methyltransferase domain-containing protein, partial [Pseudomonadota bacterium]|nr:methyltransferase domain-containing protein [Pseudomonadota bacterium]
MQTIRFKNFDFYPNQKILDIGCGQGRHCFGAYMHADLDVYGIDMGFDDVKKAYENFNQFNERLDKKSCNFIVG